MSGTIYTFTGDLTTKTAQSLDQDGDATTPYVIFSTYDADLGDASGTGVFQPFVRIEEGPRGDGTQEGYNYEPDLTGNPPVPLDVKDNQQVVDLTQVAIIVIDGVQYYDFRLDVNEPNNPNSKFITVTDLKFYSSAQADLFNLNPDTNTWTDFSE